MFAMPFTRSHLIEQSRDDLSLIDAAEDPYRGIADRALEPAFG